MNTQLRNYWLWQLMGWGALGLMSLSIAFSFDYIRPHYILVLIFYILTGIAITHGIRAYIIKKSVFKNNIQKQVVSMLLLSIAGAFVASIINMMYVKLIGYTPSSSSREYTLLEKFVMEMLNNYFVFFVWNLIYFVYYHIQRNRKREMDNLRLETLVKSLELKTIKSHINPHFIFNSLNSIRALVDENPARARTAITELSKILRSSLQSQNAETATLEEEIDIVKNFLALEKLRYEERLTVQYHIDSASLKEQIPPMMVQTLVENAIKHGIAKTMEGGFIQVSTNYQNEDLVITVRNTGNLAIEKSHGGFGISSTRERLIYLYHGRAKFDIRQDSPNIVESKILIPIKNSALIPEYV